MGLETKASKPSVGADAFLAFAASQAQRCGCFLYTHVTFTGMH